MSERLMYREEELLQAAAPLPVLSNGLRSRVLAAAGQARARRTQGRRVLGRTAVVFSLMMWLAWTGPFLPSAGQLAGIDQLAGIGQLTGIEPTAPAASLLEDGSSPAAPPGLSSCSRRERFIAAMDDDWRMVEAEFQSREDITRRIQRM